MWSAWLEEALARLDARLTAVLDQEERRASALTLEGSEGWAGLRALLLPPVHTLLWAERPASLPIVPPGDHPLARLTSLPEFGVLSADILLTLFSAYIEPRYRLVLATLGGDENANSINERALALICARTPKHRAAFLTLLAPGGALVRSGFLVGVPGPGRPGGRAWELAPDVLGALNDVGAAAALAPRQHTFEIGTADGATTDPLVVVYGSGDLLSVARESCSGTADRLVPWGQEAVAAVRAAWRWSVLSGHPTLLDLTGHGEEVGPAALEAESLASRFGGRLVLLTREAQPIAGPHRVARRYAFEDRREAWASAARRRGIELTEAALDRLAAAWPFGPDQTERVARAAEGADEAALAKAAARLVHVPVPHGVAVPARRGFEDLVVRRTTRDALERLVHFVLHRDRLGETLSLAQRFQMETGPVVLFAGRSGTGKTLAAEVVARTLGRPLYVVDLSRLVSKYIGETEKNIDQVLDGAERAGVVLFFDEADALFSARTEVSTSNDRYANLEVGFLLQRIEQHHGLVILATNLRHAIDEAFLRRFQFRVEFPFPEVEERTELWKRMLAGVTTAPLDLDRLAQAHRLAGGDIRNAALRAIFLAERAGVPLTGAHLDEAVAIERLEMGWLSRVSDEEARDRGALLTALTQALEDHLRERLSGVFRKEIHIIHGSPTKEVLAGRRPAVSIALYRLAVPRGSGAARVGFVLSAWSQRPEEEAELLGVVHEVLSRMPALGVLSHKISLRVQESYDFDLLHRFWSSHNHPVRASVVLDGELE